MITGLAGASIWNEDHTKLLRGRTADPARHMVGLTSSDVTADCKRLKDAGVEFVEDPRDYGNLIIVTLKDPEGNLVQLFQRTAGV
jgi:Glyoxalase/Bleomycin resistance protein/Dioxygenase superfamily